MNFQSTRNRRFILGVSILISTLLYSACSSFGSKPNGSDHENFLKSKQYNQESRKFENRRVGLLEEMRKNARSWAVMKEWLNPHPDVEPLEELPQEKPDFEKFLAGDGQVIWFGHSSFLLRLNDRNILVDPVFSDYASPFRSFVPRFQKPVAALEDLPAIDIVLISHDHYDHLDEDSIKFFQEKQAVFLVPLGVGAHLRGWGIEDTRIIEHDWWQTSKLFEISFTATPAQHFSGRIGIDGNQTLWASWVINNENTNIYFSGDSGYDTHFKEIGDKLGPFDLAFIECGQYNEKWREVHMLPEEAFQAYKDLRAQTFFPIHWAMFKLSTHAWYDPIESLQAFAERGELKLVAPRLGEIVSVKSEFSLVEWWNSVARSEVKKEFAVSD